MKNLTTIILGAGLAAAGHATDYHVGPNQPLLTLADVHWNQLQPGDNVYVHYKKGGYHETFQLMNSGTAAQPIRVIGVNDPLTGLRPMLTGAKAVVGPSINQGYYTYLYIYGGIIIIRPRGSSGEMRRATCRSRIWRSVTSTRRTS